MVGSLVGGWAGILALDAPGGPVRCGQPRGDPRPPLPQDRGGGRLRHRAPPQLRFTEQWRGEEMIVHRKGATPPAGVLGIVPGTMADPGYLTLGLGAEESLNSAAHGAGRRMAAPGVQRTRRDRLARGLAGEGDQPSRRCARRGARRLQRRRRGDGRHVERPGGGHRGVLTQDRTHGRRPDEVPAQAEEEAGKPDGSVVRRAVRAGCGGRAYRNLLMWSTQHYPHPICCCEICYGLLEIFRNGLCASHISANICLSLPASTRPP